MIESNTMVGTGMKVVCQRDELSQKLGVVARAVSTRASVQILSGVLLRAEGGRLHLAATDMELSLRSSLDAEVGGDGAVVVPGRLLVDLVRLLPENEVTIEHRAEESVVHITSGSSTSTLHTFAAEDFPRLPDLDTVGTFTVDREALLDTISRVARSASRDESRPVLTGILVRFEQGKLVMAATDSYRLSVKETPLEGDAPELEAIIPARALAELTRIAQSGENVELGVHENQVVFAADDVWLTTRRIDGQFPNYKQLLPETFEHEVTLPRNEVLDVVRRVGVMVQRTSPIQLRFAEGELTVFARTQDVGEAKESLPVQFSGEPLEIGFNAEFLREGLESLHVGTQGFSPRTRADAQLVRFGERAGRVGLRGRRGESAVELEVTLELGEGKKAKLNGAALRAAEQLRSEIATLVFTPDRLAVVKGGPAVRRAYFDRVLGRLAPVRAPLVADYAAAVAQRNAALRRVAAGFSSREALAPWTERVADLGHSLVEARTEVIALLAPGFADRAEELGLAVARLVYEGAPPSVEELEAQIDRDVDRGTTGIGPHLDDIQLLSGPRDLRSFGSQGEQRLTVLALLLAEAELIADRRGYSPLLLLDDVLSELDPSRRCVLADRVLEAGQTLITATQASSLPVRPAQLLEVSPGLV